MDQPFHINGETVREISLNDASRLYALECCGVESGHMDDVVE